MAHTPSPWTEGPTEGIGQKGKLIVVDSRGVKIADCEAPKPTPLTFARPLSEDTANARLIAAAPDLLESAKHWLSVHHRAMQSRAAAEDAFNSGLITKAELWLQAAIAKAEGR